MEKQMVQFVRLIISAQGNYRRASIIDILILLVAFIAVLWIAQWFSKKIAGMQVATQKGKLMKIVEILYVSPGKILQIIQVGDRYFLIAVHKEGITYLAELASADIKDQAELTQPVQSYPFADYFSKFKKKAGHKDEN